MDNSGTSGGNSHIIDMEKACIPLVNSMQESLESLPPLSSERCIFMVSPKLQKNNEAAYTPLTLSIGQFHHGKVGLQAMEKHKRRYLHNFLRRTQKGLMDFVKILKEKEETIRQCFGEIIDFGSDEFVEMILVDAAFIIEVMWSNMFSSLVHRNGPIFHKPRMIFDINRDIMLFENQIPFFVLEDLFNLANFEAYQIPGGTAERPSLVDLTCKYFKEYLGILSEADYLLEIRNSLQARHLLDFLRNCLIPSQPPKPPNTRGKYGTVGCATKLHEAGVTFKKGESKNLFDVKFENDVLEIPHLPIDAETECILQNLIAHEWCYYDVCDMSDYTVFLDNLIDTPEDVHLLRRSGIINPVNWDNKEVLNMFNKLGKDIALSTEKYCFAGIQEQLIEYCKIPWHKWRATLKRDYFGTLWATLSIVVVAILLLLTFIQAVCSIISL